jgi:hypothetical protein
MKLTLHLALLSFVFLRFAGSCTLGQAQTNVPGLSKPSNQTSRPSNVTIDARTANLKPDISAKSKRHWDKKFWAMWLPAIAVQVGDAALTQQCLTHPDCREGNPLLGKRPSPWLLYGVKVGVVGVSYLYSRAARQGRDKSWLAYPIALTVLGSAGVVNNAIVLSHLDTQPRQDQALATIKQSTVANVSGCAACITLASFSHFVPSSLTQPTVSDSVKLKYELKTLKTH